MWTYLVTMAGLGMLGFDPAPGLIGAGARSMGARKRTIALFAVLLVGGTAVWGVLLTLVVGPGIRTLHWMALAQTRWALVLEGLIGVALLGWGLWSLSQRFRTRRGLVRATDEEITQDTKASARVASGVGPLMVVAAFFVVIVISDPPFPAAIVASAHQERALVLVGFALWALISQSPLVILVIASAIGLDDAVVAWSQTWTAKVGPVVRLLTAGCAIVAALAIFVWIGVAWPGTP